MVDNSVPLCDGGSVVNILDLSLKKAAAIEQRLGIPPETLNTLHNSQISYAMTKRLQHHHWYVEQQS